VTITIQHVYTDGTQLFETSKQSTNGEAVAVKKEVKLSQEGFWKMILLVLAQVIFVTMAYGPIAAFLVELFPTKIRYTSMSLPYHIGNGVFGGLTPFLVVSFFEMSKTSSNPGGDPIAGLWYPIAVAAVSFVIGMIFLKNKAVPAE